MDQKELKGEKEYKKDDEYEAEEEAKKGWGGAGEGGEG